MLRVNTDTQRTRECKGRDGYRPWSTHRGGEVTQSSRVLECDTYRGARHPGPCPHAVGGKAGSCAPSVRELTCFDRSGRGPKLGRYRPKPLQRLRRGPGSWESSADPVLRSQERFGNA